MNYQEAEGIHSNKNPEPCHFTDLSQILDPGPNMGRRGQVLRRKDSTTTTSVHSKLFLQDFPKANFDH